MEINLEDTTDYRYNWNNSINTTLNNMTINNKYSVIIKTVKITTTNKHLSVTNEQNDLFELIDGPITDINKQNKLDTHSTDTYVYEYVMSKVKIRTKEEIKKIYKNINIFKYDPEKKYLQTLYDGKQKNELIFLYQPFNNTFPRYWELLKSFPIADYNKPIKVLSLFFHEGAIEAIMKYREKYFDYRDNFNLYLFTKPYSKEHIKIFKTSLHKMQSIYNINYKPISTDITNSNKISEIFNDMNNKVDLYTYNNYEGDYHEICLDNYRCRYMHRPHLRTLDTISGIIVGFTILKKGGNAFFQHQISTTDVTIMTEMIYLLTTYFNSVQLVKPQVSQSQKLIYFIICRNFQGIAKDKLHDLYDGFNKLDELSQNKILNTRDKKMRREMGIQAKFDSKEHYDDFLISFFEFEKKIPDSFYQKIEKFYRHLLKMQIIRYQEIIDYDKLVKTSTEQHIQRVFEHNQTKFLSKSIQWCKKYDLEVKHKYLETFENYKQYIINESYTVRNVIIHKFVQDRDDTLPPIKRIGYDESHVFTYNKLLEKKRRLNLYKRAIDTRNPDKWRKVTYTIKLYETLKKYLMKEYGAGDPKVTNAWIKMYEILNSFNLIDKDKDTLRTFHTCEAPGSFMSAINHYLKTQTNVKTFDWYANSLNPYNEENKRKYGTLFGDAYGIISNFKNRWLFGPQGTGDITSVENIRHYANHPKLQNIDLFTSDCGLGLSNKEFNEQEKILSILNYSQIMICLSVLPKGKHCILKAFIPLAESVTVSLLYLMYCVFDRLYVCKPVTSRPGSSEVYIIGKEYKGISKDYLERLYKILENYDPHKSIFKREDIPESFMAQVMSCSETFVNQQVDTISRSFFYYDNYDDIKKKHLPIIEKATRKRNKEWTKKFRFKSVKREDKLIKKS